MFRFWDSAHLLELTRDERMLVELRMAIARTIRHHREQLNLSQTEVALRIKSNQPSVAAMENGAPEIGFDQMFHALFAVGGSVGELAHVVDYNAKHSRID